MKLGISPVDSDSYTEYTVNMSSILTPDNYADPAFPPDLYKFIGYSPKFCSASPCRQAQIQASKDPSSSVAVPTTPDSPNSMTADDINGKIPAQQSCPSPTRRLSSDESEFVQPKYTFGRIERERSPEEIETDRRYAAQVANDIINGRNLADLPESYDWRTKNAACTKSIKMYSQGTCGSCCK